MAIPKQPGECRPEDYHFGGAHTLRPFATVPSSPRCLASPLVWCGTEAATRSRHTSAKPLSAKPRLLRAAIVNFLVPEPPELKSKQL